MSEIATTALDAARVITTLWRSGKADSLIEYTKPTRVEPIVLIDSSVLYADALPEVQQSLLNMFAGYYLMAVATMADIGGVNVGRALDKLNPNRSAGDALVNSAGWMLARESYKDGLPDFRAALEAVADDVTTDKKPASAQAAFNAAYRDAPGGGVKDAASQLKDLANLSIGRLLTVELVNGQHKASIPVNLRLIASTLPTESLTHILSLGQEDTSMTARWHGWRSGRLEFIRDIIFCEDLIDAHRKALKADKDGAFANIIKRQRSGTLASIASLGDMSVATASNMVIMSRETQAIIENNIGGGLRDFKTREKIFAKTSLMIMAVIDNSYDRIVFYHRSIPEHTSVSRKDLMASNKGTGPDVTEILKAYQLASAPSL